jgi:hypothetical protein
MRSRAATLAVACLVLFLTAGAGSCGSADHDDDEAAPATARPEPVASAAEAPADSGVVNSQAEIVVLFSNTNDDGVQNGAAEPATLVLDRAATVTYIQTYHWNDGAGVEPGEIVIRGADGTEMGRWPAYGEDGQGGVRNAYWAADPAITLAAGTYLVEDSDAASRSTNALMGGIGQTIVRGFFEP